MINHWKITNSVRKPQKCQGCLKWIEVGDRALKGSISSDGMNFHIYVHSKVCAKILESKRLKNER